MSAPNLQIISLEQYVSSTQDTENDSIYTKLREKEKEIDDRCENLHENSNEYKNYSKAYEAFEKAEEVLEKAKEIYSKYKSNLDADHDSELDAVRNSAAQERKKLIELVDPYHENFNQCLDCKKIINKENVQHCCISNCESNQNYCADCFSYSEGGFKRKCQYCFLPACSNGHHYTHVKKCSEYWKNNICGFEPRSNFGSEVDVFFFDEYHAWSEENWCNKPEDAWVLFTGRIDRENYCNQITQNLQNCCFCGNSFCSNCADTNGYCHGKDCVVEHRKQDDIFLLITQIGQMT